MTFAIKKILIIVLIADTKGVWGVYYSQKVTQFMEMSDNLLNSNFTIFSG